MPHGRRPSIDAPGQRRERAGPTDCAQVVMKRVLWLVALAIGFGAAASSSAQSPGNFSTLSTTGTATMGGDTLMCSGRPWIDVRCNGAVGDGSHDDTAAINTTISAAVSNDWPVHLPAGTYKVTSQLTIDYAGQASKGFRLISQGAGHRWPDDRLGAGAADRVRRRDRRQPDRVLLFEGRGYFIRQRRHVRLRRRGRQNRFLRRA